MAWERRRDRQAGLPRALAIAELHVGGRGLDVAGRTASHSDCAVPCVRAVAARDGKGLLVQAALQGPAVGGPKTASSHWCQPDDAGVDMIWTVRPVPAHVSDCGLRSVAKPSWRRSWGGPFGPAGEIRPRRTPFAHDKGV